jgi:hypothetical protein
MMTESELKDYAYGLIMSHAQDVEWLTIHEMAEDFEDFTDSDAHKVDELIGTAIIEVYWE